MIIDLSQPLTNNTPHHLDDIKTTINQTKSVSSDGYMLTELTTTMHSGTHVDLPAHFINTNKLALDYPIDAFIGKAKVFDLSNQTELMLTNEQLNLIKRDDIIILATRFDKNYGNKEYYTKYPAISYLLAKELVTKKIKMIVIDTPSVDYPPYQIHQILLDANIMIVENTTNLASLLAYQEITFYAVPLKIMAEASLVRAFAVVK